MARQARQPRPASGCRRLTLVDDCANSALRRAPDLEV
jgi:hypothetical protein